MDEVSVGTWVNVGDCRISYTVFSDQVEFNVGGYDGFDMVTSEAGLENLVTTTTAALRELRSAEVFAEEVQDSPPSVL